MWEIIKSIFQDTGKKVRIDNQKPLAEYEQWARNNGYGALSRSEQRDLHAYYKLVHDAFLKH